MQFADLNGITMHYQQIGGPERRPTLVFANSLGTDFRIWRDVIVQLAGEFPILTYDKRGHGLSGIGEAPYSIEDHVWDLSALLDHAKVERAIVVGLSVGGMIAMGLQAARPELVEALVLCDTAHRIGSPDMWDERIEAVEELGLEGIADAVMERWFTPDYRADAGAAYVGFRNMFMRQPAEGYMATCAAIRDAEMSEMARQIDTPTVCVVGDQDMATPVDLVSELSGLIDGARFEVIAGAGHLPCIEQPDVLAELIRTIAKEVIGKGAKNG